MVSLPARQRQSGWRALAVIAVAGVAATGAVVVHSQQASAATVDPTTWYLLLNRNSGKVMDVAGVSAADGAQIQQFQFVDSGGGYCRPRARHTGKDFAPQALSYLVHQPGNAFHSLPWRLGLLTRTNSTG